MASLGTSPKKPKSVTYVSGIMCYPSIGMGTAHIQEENATVVERMMSSVWVISIALLLLTARCGQGVESAQLQEPEGTGIELEEVDELKEKLNVGNRILDLEEWVAPLG